MHRLFIVLAFILTLGLSGPVLAGEGCQHSQESAVQAKAPAPQKGSSARVEAEKVRKTCGEGVACEVEHADDPLLASRERADD